jgi:hypothetical protein
MYVSKFTNLELQNTSYSAHRVIWECDENTFGGKGVQLYANHYVGSLEAYLQPNDLCNHGDRRRGWLDKANVSGGVLFTGDEIRPWLQGFVDFFGNERSQYLLENVGFPYNNSTALHVL